MPYQVDYRQAPNEGGPPTTWVQVKLPPYSDHQGVAVRTRVLPLPFFLGLYSEDLHTVYLPSGNKSQQMALHRGKMGIEVQRNFEYFSSETQAREGERAKGPDKVFVTSDHWFWFWKLGTPRILYEVKVKSV